MSDRIGEIIGASAGQSHSLFWSSKGFLLGCGSNKYGQLTSNSLRISTLSIIDLGPDNGMFCLMAACGLNHSLVLCSTTSTIIPNSSSSSPTLLRLLCHLQRAAT